MNCLERESERIRERERNTDTDNDCRLPYGLKKELVFPSLFIICFVCVIVFYLLFASRSFEKSKCILEEKYYEPYMCHVQSFPCGPTTNYKTMYYLKEVNTNISKWVCSQKMQFCNCCAKKGCLLMSTSPEIIGDCYPIIATSLDTYSSMYNGSMIDCWIDSDGNYLIKNQKLDIDANDATLSSVVIMISVMIICMSFIMLCHYTCDVVLKRCYKPNDIMITDKIGDKLLETEY